MSEMDERLEDRPWERDRSEGQAGAGKPPESLDPDSDPASNLNLNPEPEPPSDSDPDPDPDLAKRPPFPSTSTPPPLTPSFQGQGAGEPFVIEVEQPWPTPEPEGPPRRKPWLARLLNRLGLRTGPGVEWLLDWVQVLAVAALLAWVTMTFVVVRMRVPTGSMEPTIHAGSSFFVDKLSYYFRSPQPGDIIVFWHREGGKRVRYVKRLIATEGQTVQIKDCVKYPPETCGVYVDGRKLTGEAFDRPYYASGKMGDQAWTVPEGKFFVLGDNSRNSLDSRFWGFADRSDFIGEPFLRVWPLSEFGFMNGYFGSPR